MKVRKPLHLAEDRGSPLGGGGTSPGASTAGLTHCLPPVKNEQACGAVEKRIIGARKYSKKCYQTPSLCNITMPGKEEGVRTTKRGRD